MPDFFAFENRTVITATLVTKTALSVGSRASLFPTGSDLPVMKTPEGIPYIPGSSLKGVVRAYTERLLRTLDATSKRYQGQRLWACDPLDDQGRCVVATCGSSCTQCAECRGNCCTNCPRCKTCITQRATENGRMNDEKLTRGLWEQLCTACRLLGSPWIASRVAFQDALLANRDDMVRLVEVRDGVGIDRDLGTAKTHIKYDFETVPAGASFSVRIMADNCEDWELGLLLLALQALEREEVPIGGKSTRGTGWVALEGLVATRIDKANLLGWLAGHAQPIPLDRNAVCRTFLDGVS